MLTVIAVIVLGLLTTLWARMSAVSSTKKNLENLTLQRLEVIEKFIGEKLVAYKTVIQGSAGLFDSNKGTITKEQWRIFAQAYDFKKQLPAVELFGYVETFEPQQLNEHQARIRKQFSPQYVVNPDVATDEYAVVIYVEPETKTSPIGFNMMSEPLRAQALKQAQASGELTLSSVLTLKNMQNKAFLMVYPLYSQGTSELIARESKPVAYSYLAINIDKLFGLVEQQPQVQGLEFAVSEGEELNSQNYIYKTAGFRQEFLSEAANQVININEKKWVIHAAVDKNSAQYKSSKTQPIITVLVGLLATIILAFSLGQTLRSKSKQVEHAKELELQKSRDELLSLASHQLRTPATAVKQYIGMLLEGYAGKLDKKQREFLRRAYASNERQLDIVNQILHISRIESGSLVLADRPVNIGKLINEVITDQKKIIKNKKQKIKKTTEKSLPQLNGDPVYLGIVIENLITNASKYTPEGGSISVTVYSVEAELILEVSDTGVGIDKHDIDKLFKKFNRVYNELSIRSGGSGIGLYLSKLIIELHGGSIEVVSRKGVGSTFRVKLPINQEKDKL